MGTMNKIPKGNELPIPLLINNEPGSISDLIEQIKNGVNLASERQTGKNKFTRGCNIFQEKDTFGKTKFSSESWLNIN